MAKPSTDDLGDLLGVVTATLTEATAITETQAENGDTVRVLPSPAFIAAAITLLKNNNVTADVSRNEGLSKLRDAMANRATKRAVPKALPVDDPVVVREVDRLLDQWNAESGSVQ